MKKSFTAIFLTCISLSTAAMTAEPVASVGVVNFTSCVTDSKLGKQEQASFESVKKQMTSLLEDTEKQINELATRFNDPEFLDALSPEAEEKSKAEIYSLNEKLKLYQQQYYQVLNQSNMQVIQTISSSINAASEKVAKEKKLGLVVNRDACFFFASALDVTELVIAEMNKTYDQLAKQPSATPSQQAAVQPAIEETKAK